MAEKELPLDAPPSYPSASVTVPYAAPPAATTMAIVQRTEVQQLSRQYSCANPMMEVIERIARVAFIVILITYAGLTIAAMARVTTSQEDSVYYNHNDDYYYETTGPNFLPVFIFVIFFASLCCTVGALLCDIPVMIAHFITNQVVNSVVFQTLDVVKWTALTIGYVIVFVLITSLIESESDYSPGSVIIACLVFCAITIVMGVIMAIWDCSHMFVNTTTPSSQVVTMVPAKSIATTVV